MRRRRKNRGGRVTEEQTKRSKRKIENANRRSTLFPGDKTHRHVVDRRCPRHRRDQYFFSFSLPIPFERNENTVTRDLDDLFIISDRLMRDVVNGHWRARWQPFRAPIHPTRHHCPFIITHSGPARVFELKTKFCRRPFA